MPTLTAINAAYAADLARAIFEKDGARPSPQALKARLAEARRQGYPEVRGLVGLPPAVPSAVPSPSREKHYD